MKLTKKFNDRLEEIDTFLKSMDGKVPTDEEAQLIGGYTIQREILIGLQNGVQFQLRELDLNADDIKAVENIDGILIQKFNTPDKVTDIEGGEYQRVKIKSAIIFKKAKENRYFVIIKAENQTPAAEA